MGMGEQIPTLSLRDAADDAFARALEQAYERFGFVVIADHGIDSASTAACLAMMQRFFALPESGRRTYHVEGGGGARGYTPFGIETAKGAIHHDLKEFWHVGRELPPGHPYRRYMPDNVWVNGIPGFRDALLSAYEAFDAVGRVLLRAIARSLGLDASYFDDKVQLGNSVLRIIHYPPTQNVTSGVRADAHEDINVITLLLGAEEPGLQILSREGHWLDIAPAPGSLVCNVGDMLQRLTNNVLRSTTHRVVNPPRNRAGKARFSMPFFLHFNPDFVIRTLPACVTPARPDLYPEPITADEFLGQRLREIRLL